MTRHGADAATVAEMLTARVEALVADLVRGDDAPAGAVVRLEVPAVGLAHAAAAGTARADTGEDLTVDHPFHVASVGKLCTAALVLQLAEGGRLGPAGVDVTLGELGVLEPALIDRLLVRAGRSVGPTITVRQLLPHTSGLADVHSDDADGTAEHHGRPAPGGLAADYWRALRDRAAGRPHDPDLSTHRWRAWDPTRPDDELAGTLNRYVARLGAAPVAAPGERFHYSDSAYALLALLVERLGGESYHLAQRRRLLEPLGLTHTWQHGHEPPPPEVAHPECDVWMGPIPVLSTGANLTFDWGGGGQVSTVADLCRLLDGLLAGRCFTDPATVALMTDWVRPAGLTPPRVDIGLGPQRWAGPSGVPVVGHAGAWGTRLWRDTTTGATVAGTVNRRDDGAWAFALLDEVRALLSDAALPAAHPPEGSA